MAEPQGDWFEQNKPQQAQGQGDFFAQSGTQKPALGGDATGPNRPLDPTSVRDSLIKGFGGAGQAIMGAVPAAWHTLTDPASPEEQKAGYNDSLARFGPLQASRMLKPVQTAVDWYSDAAKGKINNPYEQVLSVANEALGQGGGQAIAGKLAAEAPGALKGVGEAAPSIVRAGVRGANTALAKYPTAVGTTLGSAAGAMTGIPYGTEMGGAAGLAMGRELLPNIKLPGEGFGLPNRVTGGPEVAPQYQPPAPVMNQGTAAQTIPVQPSQAPPVYPPVEPAIPGVNARPSIERVGEFQPSSSLARASEPPAPATPSATQPKPSIGRIKEMEPAPVKTEASAGSPSERAPIAKPPAKTEAKPVEAPTPADRAKGYRLGKNAGDPRAEQFLTSTNQQLVDMANKLKIDGRTDWSPADLKRTGSVHGKYLSPAKEALIEKLVKHAPTPSNEPLIEFDPSLAGKPPKDYIGQSKGRVESDPQTAAMEEQMRGHAADMAAKYPVSKWQRIVDPLRGK